MIICVVGVVVEDVVGAVDEEELEVEELDEEELDEEELEAMAPPTSKPVVKPKAAPPYA